MSENISGYEERLVAFVDILGWTHATSRLPALSLLQTLQPILDRGNFHNQHYRQSLVDRYGGQVNPMMLKVQFAFFSDCFIISMPMNFHGRIYSAVSELILPLLNEGFVLRGGVVAGNIYHKDNIVFGPALIRAYEIEQNEAKFARILIDKSALEAIRPNEDDAVMLDHLGDWIIDPFPYIVKTNETNEEALLSSLFDPSTIIKVLKERVLEHVDRPRIRDIWRFQTKVCGLSLDKYGAAADGWTKDLHALAA